MDTFVTYILYAEDWQKIYIGYSSNLIARYYSHNHSKKGHTRRYRPWIVLDVEFHHSKVEAMRREKFLKSGKGRSYIREVVIPNYQAVGFISA